MLQSIAPSPKLDRYPVRIAADMVTIQPLPAPVVHLIAAGEVIDSLAAVVRELVENALDAGATRIVITLSPDRWQVRVADNGSGMSLADLRRAANPHSTSKIRDRADLSRIMTLGFRGEALHSLAQLANLEISSRTRESGEGWQVRYTPKGEVDRVETAAIAPGTVVTVADLFGRWLARRQGLPSMAQQLRGVQLVIQHMALCHPHVTWVVQQKHRRWFTISPGKTARQILPQIVRNLHPSDLQDVKVEVPDAGESMQTLEATLGLPDRCHRRRADWVKVAVNGRIVRVPELEQVAISAFARTLPRDRYPLCFLHLRLAPETIDWNRHPAKAEIYLHRAEFWQEKVSEAIAEGFQLSRADLSVAHQPRMAQVLKAAEASSGYNVGRSVDATDEEIADRALFPLEAIAQVHNTYILAQHPQGLYLIEQHVAHERVLYEQLRDRWHLVPLEPPAILSQLTSKQIEQLQRLGLEVDPFGDGLWAVRNAPEILAGRGDRLDILLELSRGDELAAAQATVACRSAITNGKPLEHSEMQRLLDRWQRTRHPRTCPHGRPIYLSLEESDLARFFRRQRLL